MIPKEILMLTEKEKMIKGLIYDATDPQLTKDRETAEELNFKFNSLPPSKRKEKDEITKQLFGKVGKNFFIRSTMYVDYGYNIEIGDNFYANHNLTILDCAKVKFGDNVFIAPNCGFYTAGHPLVAQERNTLLEYAYPITIGNNVDRCRCTGYARCNNRRQHSNRRRKHSDKRYPL